MTQEERSPLIARAADGTLAPEEAARLLAACREDAAVLHELTAHVTTERLLHVVENDPHGRLAAQEFGLRLDQERIAAMRATDFVPRVVEGARRRRWLPRFAIAAGLLAALFVFRPRPQTRSVPVAQPTSMREAVLLFASETQWSEEGADLRPGDLLPHTRLKLLAGLATIELASGAQVSLEAPAEWIVTGPNSMRLDLGRATASIPERAQGFRMETPAGVLVDYGTVFGVQVESGGATEAHVFEGRVELQAAGSIGAATHPLRAGAAVTVDPAGGLLKERKADPHAFPTPARRLDDVLFGGGFEPGLRLARGGMPTGAGGWSGDWCEVVPAADGVKPRAGQLMLQFLRADSVPAAAPSTRSASELWQCVDVRRVREQLGATGPLVAEARAFFNTGFPALARKSPRFSVKLVAWSGSLRNVKQAWTRQLHLPEAVVGGVENTFTADSDPGTWESLDATLTLPPEADSMVLGVASFADRTSDKPFPANYADSVSLSFSVPPQPAIAKHERRPTP